jgi:ubiquinone/menaquinone biosynthesis C-methylase UbiE/acyl carrier protein
VEANRVHLAGWQNIYDEAYSETSKTAEDDGISSRVWISSYTGQPFSRDEVLDSVNDTLKRILSLHPRRLLEIGCGTGLILSQLAPYCESCYATDFSGAALDRLKRRFHSEPWLQKAVVLEQPAHDFHNIPEQFFDVVVLNEVVQYFPDVHYLLRVLEGVFRVAAPESFVFIGGIRNFDLLKMFHASVELHRAPASLTSKQLHQRITKSIEHEKELLISPQLFCTLRTLYPLISNVRCLVKGGKFLNEFTKFRYDAILRIGSPAEPLAVEWFDQANGAVFQELRNAMQLSGGNRKKIGIRGLANSRISTDAKLLHLLERGDDNGTVGDLREELGRTSFIRLSVEQIHSLAEQYFCGVQMNWPSHGPLGCFDVIFHELPLLGDLATQPLPSSDTSAPRWHLYANMPLRTLGTEEFKSRLYEFLKSRLPDYMVPSSFMMLDGLPLSNNGKVNRKALPPPELQEHKMLDMQPRTHIEQLLASIWEETLGVDQVGVHDDFFALGGHSLLATQVASRIEATFHIQMSLRSLFTHTTLRQLASAVEQARDGGKRPPLREIVPLSRDVPLPLSFAQQRLWLAEQYKPGTAIYSIPVGLRLRGPLNLASLERSIQEIVRRHESLRSAILPNSGEPVQTPVSQVPDLVLTCDLCGLPQDRQLSEATKLLEEEVATLFDLQRGQVFRSRIFRLNAADHILLLTWHHIAFDGWSVGVFARELSVLYDAYSRQDPSPLPEPSIQYADFAVAQRVWLEKHSQSQLGYWKQRLSGAPRITTLVGDKGPATGDRADSHTFQVASETAHALQRFIRQRGVTIFMAALAAFEVVLNFYTGAEDVIVGTDVANRITPQLESMIGFFVNQLALRTSLAGNPTFEEMVIRVRETTLDAYDHQDIPFEQVLQSVLQDREAGEIPLFQTKVVLQNMPTGKLRLTDLEMESLYIPPRGTAFDLVLFLSTQPDGVSGVLEYDATKYSDVFIQRVCTLFEAVLQAGCANPGTRLADLRESLAIIHSELIGRQQARIGPHWEKLSTLKRKAAVLQ